MTTGRDAPAAATSTAKAEVELPKLSPQVPELLDRLQPLLNKGANMKIASEGFRDAELFASVAHAAKNIEVPFVLLKHRVLREGMTLERAIAELKPKVNAAVEAERARAEARSDHRVARERFIRGYGVLGGTSRSYLPSLPAHPDLPIHS